MANSIDQNELKAQSRVVFEGLRDDPDALTEVILRQAIHIGHLKPRVEELVQMAIRDQTTAQRAR